jgi:ubiquinone/menaquinone biosynthesis C-methylase UbiE
MTTHEEPTLDDQYRLPSGAVGQRIGQEMATDHLPENQWTVNHLRPHPTDHILEIGFGPGVAIELLLPHIPDGKLYGIDHSALMVQEAQQRNHAAVAAGRADLRHATADDPLHFPPNTFDKVFTIHTLYFWRDAMTTLADIHRVLKPGGTLLLTMLPKERWGTNPPGSGLEYGTPDCTPYFIPDLEAMLRTIGFHTIRTVIDENENHRSNVSVIGRK